MLRRLRWLKGWRFRVKRWLKGWSVRVGYFPTMKGEYPIVMVDGIKGRLREMEFKDNQVILGFRPVRMQRTVVITEAEIIIGNKLCKKQIGSCDVERGHTIAVELACEIKEFA